MTALHVVEPKLLRVELPPFELNKLALSGVPLLATWALRPCELYRYHSPQPVRTQGHHRHPVFMQNEVYGKIQDPELKWLCGTCHDNVHEWLSFITGRARRPSPEPGRLAKTEAEITYAWYRSMTA